MKEGDVVTHRDHPEWGEGEVVRSYPDSVLVRFPDYLPKTKGKISTYTNVFMYYGDEIVRVTLVVRDLPVKQAYS